jgi:hypothetical protein
MKLLQRRQMANPSCRKTNINPTKFWLKNDPQYSKLDKTLGQLRIIESASTPTLMLCSGAGF